MAAAPPIDASDHLQLRALAETVNFPVTLSPLEQAVTTTEAYAGAADGYRVPLRVYRPAGEVATGALLYVPGGGGTIISPRHTHDLRCRQYAAGAGICVISVDYRLAPEHPYPTQAEDAYAALTWLVTQAPELGLDRARIGIGGDSAGAGICAAVTLMARDRGGPSVALQMLIYPMLDDRTTVPDPALVPTATWTYEFNATAWRCLLGDRISGDPVPGYAAPARATDLSGLPPAYLEVGDLDIFRDEDLAYAGRLVRSGGSVELHLRPGLPHGFESLAPDAPVVRHALSDRYRFLDRLR